MKESLSHPDPHSDDFIDDLSLLDIQDGPLQLVKNFMLAPNVGIAIYDLEGRYRALNPALATMHGIPVAAHLGVTFHCVLGNSAATLEPFFRQVIRTAQPVFNIRLKGKLPARTEDRSWVKHLFPLRDKQGRAIYVNAIVIEVTEQTKLREPIRQLTTQFTELGDLYQKLSANQSDDDTASAIISAVAKVIPHDCALLALEDEIAELPQATPIGRSTPEIGLRDQTRQAVEEFGVDKLLSLQKAIAFRKGGLQRIAWPDEAIREEMQSIFALRLATGPSAGGALYLLSRRPRAFSYVSGDLTRQLEVSISSALEHLRLLREIKALQSRFAVHRQIQEHDIHVGSTSAEGGLGISCSPLVGQSSALKSVLAKLRVVATTDASVLIRGETGTGKELVARALHDMSKRKSEPFVKVNCAAIPAALLEAELFGCAEGTCAVSCKIGRLELAHRGTLLLDEIGDFPLELQAKLLRVLQDGEFEPLGSTQTIRVNVRLIATTQQNLGAQVANGSFRSDLFYRLNVFPIRMPALRERREDIPLLVRYFVERFEKEMDRHVDGIPDQIMEMLEQWDWPGNVRELENVIERCVLMSDWAIAKDMLDIVPVDSEMVARTLEEVERDYIIQTVRDTHGKIAGSNGAAARLGMKRTTLQSRMVKLGIDRRDFLD